MNDIVGGLHGPGCILCPMTDNRDESKRKWSSPDRGVVCGTKSVVVFEGNSLCYAHFIFFKADPDAATKEK